MHIEKPPIYGSRPNREPFYMERKTIHWIFTGGAAQGVRFVMLDRLEERVKPEAIEEAFYKLYPSLRTSRSEYRTTEGLLWNPKSKQFLGSERPVALVWGLSKRPDEDGPDYYTRDIEQMGWDYLERPDDEATISRIVLNLYLESLLEA